MNRVLADILLIIAIYFFPVYLSFILILVAMWYFNNYVESMAFGLIIDLLYSSGHIWGINYSYFFFTLVFILYLLSFKIKANIR